MDAPQPLVQMETCSSPLCNVQGTIATNLVLVKNEDPVKGYKRQVRCKECNSAQGRVTRFLKDQGNAAEYLQLSKQGKEDFKLKIAREGLVGDKLKQLLTETVTWAKIQKSCRMFSAQGDFVTENTLRSDPKLDDEEKDAIIANTNTMVCKVTSKTLYWKPYYTMSLSNTQETVESKKRELESEEKIKPQKAPKQAKREIKDEAGQGEVPPAPQEPIIKPIPQPQLERLGKAHLVASALADKLGEQIVVAKAPDHTGVVAPMVLKQNDEWSAKFEDLIGQMSKFQDDKQAANGLSQMRCLFHLNPNLQNYTIFPAFANKSEGAIWETFILKRKIYMYIHTEYSIHRPREPNRELKT